jgi:dimethyladenosine transferase (EC 2.1.1.-)
MSYTHKKSLGQHFLHDEAICQRIVAALSKEASYVLEVGPGAAALTKYLMYLPCKDFKCVEFDEEKVIYLKKKYPLLTDKIIQADFLEIDLPFSEPFSIIGNFPYNISSQIMFKILDWRERVIEVVGMFQKEVAVRIASQHRSKDYGILSVLTQCYYDISYLFDVAPEAFVPPPAVQSGVIHLKKKHMPIYKGDYDAFRKFVKSAFATRRKTLRNCFKSFLQHDILQDSLFDKRAEQLSVEEFVELYQRIKNQG